MLGLEAERAIKWQSSSFTLVCPGGATQSERRGPLGPRKYLQAPVRILWNEGAKTDGVANKKPCPCGCGVRLGRCNKRFILNRYRNLAPRRWFRDPRKPFGEKSKWSPLFYSRPNSLKHFRKTERWSSDASFRKSSSRLLTAIFVTKFVAQLWTKNVKCLDEFFKVLTVNAISRSRPINLALHKSSRFKSFEVLTNRWLGKRQVNNEVTTNAFAATR